VFLKEIEMGITPNPDILCNRHVKFKAFTDYIFTNYPDVDFVATGHYAKVGQKFGKYKLMMAKDD